MRNLFICMGVVIAGSALADIPPPPEARNRPYLDALRADKHACASISERKFAGEAQEPAFKKVDASIFEIVCTDGPRYRMIVQQLPRGRRHIDIIRALRITKL